MVAVREVEVAVHQIADVVAMRNWLMAASGPMNVILVVARALVIRGAQIGVGIIDFEPMLLDVGTMLVMKTAVVQIVDMTVMFDGSVATFGTVGVLVLVIVLARH